MMTAPDIVVLDSSSLLDWVLKEGYHRHVSALLADTAGALLAAPPHLHAEITNAHYQRTRRTTNFRLTLREADEALATLLALDLTVLADATLYPHAVALARRYNLTRTYDALYVALADTLGGQCWTADERLANSVTPGLPFVHWVATYPLPQP